MGCLRNGRALGSTSRLGCDLCKCFQRLTVKEPKCDSGCACPAQIPRLGANHWNFSGLSERAEWIRRNRVYMPEKPVRVFEGMSHKDYWYKRNNGIIQALARAMGLHADAIFEFLYTLTLQNFGRVLNPMGHGWNICRVPLSNVDTCDDYMGIFDCNGNLRHPSQPESLLKLLIVIQSLLNMETCEISQERSTKSKTAAGNPIHLYYEPKCQRRSRRVAIRAGIGPDSVARANGLRRRYHMGEKYRLEGFRGEVNPFLAPTSWSCYCKNLSQIFCPVVNKSATSEERSFPLANKGATTFEDKQVCQKAADLCRNPLTPNRLNDSLQRTELLNVLGSVNQSTLMQEDLSCIVKALQDINLHTGKKDEEKRIIDMSNQISADYYKMTVSKPEPKVYLQPARLKEKVFTEPSKSYAVPSHHKEPTEPIIDKVQTPEPIKYYYGAQIPILAHAPFNPEDPKTWIRRHPTAERMNERNEVVMSANIRRYKRLSVQNQMKEARQRLSVRSVYSTVTSTNDSVKEDKVLPRKRFKTDRTPVRRSH